MPMFDHNFHMFWALFYQYSLVAVFSVPLLTFYISHVKKKY